VSVKGETRSARWISSEVLWKWIDAHGNEFGMGRPYLDKDPPHIAPIDGQEYADKRGVNAKLAEKGNAATSGVAKAAKPPQVLQGRAEPKPVASENLRFVRIDGGPRHKRRVTARTCRFRKLHPRGVASPSTSAGYTIDMHDLTFRKRQAEGPT
jgi:hypothetical protein